MSIQQNIYNLDFILWDSSYFFSDIYFGRKPLFKS
jgi:hypothetical protein